MWWHNFSLILIHINTFHKLCVDVSFHDVSALFCVLSRYTYRPAVIDNDWMNDWYGVESLQCGPVHIVFSHKHNSITQFAATLTRHILYMLCFCCSSGSIYCPAGGTVSHSAPSSSRQWADCGESLRSSNDLWLLQAESCQETPAAAVFRGTPGIL